MPSRKALGKEEEAKIIEAINYYKKRNMDPGYQGVFEEKKICTLVIQELSIIAKNVEVITVMFLMMVQNLLENDIVTTVSV